MPPIISPYLVPVKIFWNVLDANISKAQLDAVGLNCMLEGETIVSMNWTQANAFGGIRLMVRSCDAEKAIAILSKHHIQAITEIDADDIGISVRSKREERAQNALRAAKIGFLLCPISIYAFWLVVKVFIDKERLDSKGRRQAIWALILSTLVIAIIAIVIAISCFIFVISHP